MSDQPYLPYGGTSNPNSGYAGSDTSRERAEREATDGTLSRRQRQVIQYLTVAGEQGVTYGELGQAFSLHHGQASGVLSGLHKAGRIARVNTRRYGCKVYVLPQFVGDRTAEPPGRVARPGLGPVADEMALIMRAMLNTYVESHSHNPQHPLPGCLVCNAERVMAEYARISR